MPILVVCSACKTKLNAPDAAAGKRVKCPKPGCGTVIAVPQPEKPAFEVVEEPQFEVVEDEPARSDKPKAARAEVKPPPLKSRRAADDEGSDLPKKKRQPDDDDEESEPTPKKKRRLDDDYEESEPTPKKKRRLGDDEEDSEPTPKKKRRLGDDEESEDREKEKDRRGGRYRPKEYAPDGGFYPMGIPILLLILCLAGIFMGGLASFIGSWFYLIVLFPLAIGFGVGIVGFFVIGLTKMRHTGIAAILGLVSGFIAMLSMHYFDYLFFRLGADQPHAVNSFSNFMNLQAEVGVSIGKVGQSGFNLGYTGTWIYWSLEILMVASFTTFWLITGSRRPFCTKCDTWKEERKLGTLALEDDDIEAVLKKGDVAGLKTHEPAPEGGNIILTAFVCPNCRSDATIVIKVEEVKEKKGGETETKERAQLVYPGEALADFKDVFGEKKKKRKKEEEEEEP